MPSFRQWGRDEKQMIETQNAQASSFRQLSIYENTTWLRTMRGGTLLVNASVGLRGKGDSKGLEVASAALQHGAIRQKEKIGNG
jgi:hypothetical protein